MMKFGFYDTMFNANFSRFSNLGLLKECGKPSAVTITPFDQRATNVLPEQSDTVFDVYDDLQSNSNQIIPM